MITKIAEGIAPYVSAGIAEIAVVLKTIFEKYEQLSTLEMAEKVTSGPVVVPLMLFESVRIHLKNNSIKNTFCTARFIAYSKAVDNAEKCLRFINEKSCVDLKEVLKKLPGAIHDASFDKEGERVLSDLIMNVGALKSDKVSYFYSPVTCEGTVQHCMAIVHEFGPVGNPFCVATAYLTIGVGK